MSPENSFDSIIFDAIVNDDFATFVQLLGMNDTEIAENAMRFIKNVNPVARKPGPAILHDSSPYLLCAKYSRPEMLQYILNIPGINVNQQDANGNSGIENVIFSQKIYDRNSAIECAKLLISHHLFNVNAVDKFKSSALMSAARDGKHHEILKLLLKRKVIDVSLRDKYGFTALLRASLLMNSTNVRLLLQNTRVNVNETNNDSQTALILLAYFYRNETGLQCARQLLNHDDIHVNFVIDNDITAQLITLQQNKYLLHAILSHGRA